MDYGSEEDYPLVIWYTEPKRDYADLLCTCGEPENGKVSFYVENGAWDGVLDLETRTFTIDDYPKRGPTPCTYSLKEAK